MITVRFLGTVAELAGRAQVEIAYTQGMTLQDLHALLQPLYPAALTLVSMVIVNGIRFRDMSLPLEEDWEIVLAPKFLGG